METVKKINPLKIFAFLSFSIILLAIVVSLTYSFILNLALSFAFYATGLFVAYFAIGTGLKFVDDAYDNNRFSKKHAAFAATSGLVLMLWASLVDVQSAAIFLALVLATTVTLKTRHPPFLAATIAFIALFLLFGKPFEIDWLLFVVIFASFFADEIGAELAKKLINKKINPQNLQSVKYVWKGHHTALYILRNRYIAIAALLALVLAGWIPLLYCLAYYFLGLGYVLVEGISQELSAQEIVMRLIF
jgi:hypothetical protein